MFLCHAWNKQQREAVANGEPLPHDLDITCFEQQSTPGGVWRVHRDDVVHAYEELWTNGCCYSLEFYDYTFHQHFVNSTAGGGGVPVYLPRQDISEYITQRVTQDHASFFDDYFEFDTKVMRVEPVEEEEDRRPSPVHRFRVTTQHVSTLEITTRLFDRCVWAAGENSKGSIPASLRILFDTANHPSHQQDDGETTISDSTTTTIANPITTATPVDDDPDSSPSSSPRFCVLHSTDTKRIRTNVHGRNILLIGGGFSAEDLALQCLKWGASHVDVVTRDDEAEVTWTAQWPGPNRVHVHTEMAIRAVHPEDGSIQLSPVHFVWPNQYGWSNTNAEDDPPLSTTTILKDIQTIIFCTGYQANLSMLGDSLRPSCGTIPAWFMGTDPTLNMSELKSTLVESGWTMKRDENPAHPHTGDVPLFTRHMLRVNYNHPEMHRGIWLANPNLMFLCEHGSDVPLLSIDVHAWLLCSYLTGRVPMPSVPQLIQANHQQVVDQLDLPYLRYYFDHGYFQALQTVDSGFWTKEYNQAQTEYQQYMIRLLAKVMHEGQYPGKALGTYEQLNETGQAIIDFGMCDYYMRSDLGDYADGQDWRTFRDDSVEPENMYSLYTGHVARPLKQPWMNIHASDKDGPVSIKRGDI
jgi:hypothetical protein